MVTYNVTVQIQKEKEAEWLTWMTDHHIPEVLRTGCFAKCLIFKDLESADVDFASYQFQYFCTSLEQLEAYQRDFSPALQKDHSDRYAGFFKASRSIKQVIASL